MRKKDIEKIVTADEDSDKIKEKTRRLTEEQLDINAKDLTENQSDPWYFLPKEIAKTISYANGFKDGLETGRWWSHNKKSILESPDEI